jgi:hypothetical protein
MIDWSGITAEQGFATWAAITTFFTLYFGWKTYQLHKEKQMFELPFIVPSKFQNGSAASLDGANSSVWKIDLVKIAKPKGALFLHHDIEFDDGGSIVRSQAIEAGREERSPDSPLYVRSESWPITLEFKISLRSAPSVRRFLVVFMSE